MSSGESRDSNPSIDELTERFRQNRTPPRPGFFAGRRPIEIGLIGCVGLLVACIALAFAFFAVGLAAPLLIIATVVLLVLAFKRPDVVGGLMIRWPFRLLPPVVTSGPVRFAVILACVVIPVSGFAGATVYNGIISGSDKSQPTSTPIHSAGVVTATLTAVTTAATQVVKESTQTVAAIAPSSPATPPALPVSTHTQTSPTPTMNEPTPTPSVVGLTADQKAKVKGILLDSIAHYQAVLNQGKSALGTTPYADSFAVIAAIGEPNTSARRFSDWYRQENPMADISYNDAFGEADAHYTAQNEPTDALESWRGHMDDASADLAQWATDAVDWESQGVTTEQLHADEQKILDDLQQAGQDVTTVISES